MEGPNGDPRTETRQIGWDRRKRTRTAEWSQASDAAGSESVSGHGVYHAFGSL